MKQIIFSDMEYENRKRTTKREKFFDIMEEIIPWEELSNIHIYCQRNGYKW